MDLMNFADTFLKICGGISVIGGAGAIIWRCVSPAISLKERVEKLEEITPTDIDERVRKLEEKADPNIHDRINRIENKLDDDYQSLKKLHDLQTGLCDAIIALIDHEITGDHVQVLEEKKGKLLGILASNY